MNRKPSRRLAAVASVGCALGCSHFDRHTAVSLAMGSAYRPPAVEVGATPPRDGGDEAPLQLLAGDFHCHVSPPDGDEDVSRDLAQTTVLAKKEHLDFVVLTPHVGARFFQQADYRGYATELTHTLKEQIKNQGPDAPIYIPGFEYTDHEYGHIGFSFGDMDKLFEDYSVERAGTHPEEFMSRWVKAGGVMVVNHPLVTPLDSVVRMGRANLSWRPWTEEGPFPLEIEMANKKAQGFEAYNMPAAHLRDRYLSHPGPGTYEDTLQRLDKEILKQQRRMTPMGGTDSHEDFLRATTFVLSRERSVEGIHEAVLKGRVCVRDSRACSLEAREPGGAWKPLGAALNGANIEVRARGEAIQIMVNSEKVATPTSNGIVTLKVNPNECSLVRAEIDGGASAPIYVNCPFAVKI